MRIIHDVPDAVDAHTIVDTVVSMPPPLATTYAVELCDFCVIVCIVMVGGGHCFGFALAMVGGFTFPVIPFAVSLPRPSTSVSTGGYR